MRIAIANTSRRLAGGVETYLAQVIPALVARGHSVSLLVEEEGATERPRIPLPEDVEVWSMAQLGGAGVVEALRRWKPEVVYAHGLGSPALEAALPSVAPGVHYAHDYRATCVSGSKSFSTPQATPCARVFGLACLACYFPRRCGGLNPVTMLRQYSLAARKLRALAGYQRIATNSRHLMNEYRQHGFGDKACLVPLPVALPKSAGVPTDQSGKQGASWRLLFLGRMESQKGGDYLLEALPRIVAVVDRPVRLTMAGDGRLRAKWESKARELERLHPTLQVEFCGWADEAKKAELFRRTDLLVVPSVWPEPFGLVGVEAAHYGIPSAAFRVGGIPDWLEDGVGGWLASGDPPTPAGLAEAVLKCLASAPDWRRLSLGAAATTKRFSMERHLEALMPVLEDASNAAR